MPHNFSTNTIALNFSPEAIPEFQESDGALSEVEDKLQISKVYLEAKIQIVCYRSSSVDS